MNTIAHVAPASAGAPRQFFVAMSGLLLLIVVMGFTPSFFLRMHFQPLDPTMGPPTLPGYLHVHGAILTGWYTLLFAQATLVRARRVDLHRIVGVAGAVVAIGVVVASAVVLGRAAPRLAATGVPPEGVSTILFNDLYALICFSTLVATAISLRQHTDTHKRLLVLASVVIVGPALSRWRYFPSFLGEPPIDEAYGTLAQLVLLLVLPAYDLVSRRRVHPATAWGVGGFIAGHVPVALFAASDRALAIAVRLAQG